MSTATGSFKLAPMKRASLTFTKPLTASKTESTVWKKSEPDKQTNASQPGTPTGAAAAVAKTVTFEVAEKESAVTDEEPTEEELLKQGIHLARRLSSDVHHRDFNWDEDDDDTAWPSSMNANFLPMLNNSKEAEKTNEEPEPEPAVTKPASPAWKVTQPHNVAPIGKQLKELSEQKQHGYSGTNQLWNQRRDDMTRYRYGDHEKRYRGDEIPRQELFNETSGQVESVRRHWRGGDDRFDRREERPRRVDLSPRRDLSRDMYSRNLSRDRFSRDMSRDRFAPRDPSREIFAPRDLSRDRTNLPPPREPPKSAKSIQEEQEEVMRLAREKARQRKEEELKKEKEHLEAARRKADELVKRIEERRQQQAKEEQHTLSSSPISASTSALEPTHNTTSASDQARTASAPTPPVTATQQEYTKPVILKQRRDGPFTDDNNPAYRAATSVIGDSSEIKSDLRVSGTEKLWTGSTTGLWNSAPPQQQRGDLWGPISGTIYHKPTANGPSTSPGAKFKNESTAAKELGGAPLSPNNGHSMFQSQWSSLPNTLPTAASTLQSTATPTSPVISQPQDTPSRIGESPSISRGTSRFFPTTGEAQKENMAPSPNGGTGCAPFDMYRTTVTSSSSNVLHELNLDSGPGSGIPRVVLPPRNRQANGHGDNVIGSPVNGVNGGFKVPSLNSIQALQSTIAEKLGTNSLRESNNGTTSDGGDLPVPESPIVASGIPIEGGPAFTSPQTKQSRNTDKAPSQPVEGKQELSKRKPVSFADAVRSGLSATANSSLNATPTGPAALTPNRPAVMAAPTGPKAMLKADADGPQENGTNDAVGTASFDAEFKDLDLMPIPIETQAKSSQLEEAVTEYFKLNSPDHPNVRIASANNMDLDLDVPNDEWDSGLIPASTSFPESSFYYESPTSVAFLREFKPRKDILVAILVPGGKKITTGYRHLSGSNSKRESASSASRGRRKKVSRKSVA